jgi:hypothetical protein
MGLHFLPAETLLKESIRDMCNNRDNCDNCDKCDKKQAVYLPQHPGI